MFNRSSKKKVSFERFLTCEYARDYIDQNTPYALFVMQFSRY